MPRGKKLPGKAAANRAVKNYKAGSKGSGYVSGKKGGGQVSRMGGLQATIAKGIRRRAAGAGKKLSGGTVRRRSSRQAQAFRRFMGDT